ncbi:hypothetical protein F4V57_10745 [Acinetobacter qingfengensis]|uniref:Lipoprotein n=1 Tax=Acinetobacter qingfengensis TaxID=1262585 RepID=A0A1E7RD37_9GAMM|nr:hypothetical protein [Acinetobacter qingfengensis]KAA8732092.1 hypothetical protein F4V57_10745 [Acinetobacter qingfengensis]OEY97172.1 hypothetical protein BJI46_01725 [Acinetobacter qingfengensis]
MKKLAIVALVSALTGLTACSKPVSEVKSGDKAISPASAEASAVIPANQSNTIATANSTDPNAALKSDIVQIQQFGTAQEQKAADLEKRMNAAVQKQDKAALKKLLPEFKAFVSQSNSEFNKLSLISSEAKQLREKMTQSSQLGVEMSEKMLADKPDEKALQALQQKIVTTQQELMTISQDIHSKIAPPQAASAPVAADKKP